MILVDSNLLVYAHVSSLPQHGPAKAWLDGQLNGNNPVGLPCLNSGSFLSTRQPEVFY